MTPAIAVIAKVPIPGRVKTRLSPPCSLREAADLAAAALDDTLAAVAAATCGRRILVLDGVAGDWALPGFDVVPQRSGGLGSRLAGAFAAAAGPALVIGMDTPQVSASMLTAAVTLLEHDRTDAVFGPALDGGYWALGLTTPDERVFDGVPMSTDVTGARQLARLRALGLRVRRLPTLQDVDLPSDAAAVAAIAPGTRFAATLDRIGPDMSLAS